MAESKLKEKVVCAEIAHTTRHGAIHGKAQAKTVTYYTVLDGPGKISHKMLGGKQE